jgi:hypothetical protein
MVPRDAVFPYDCQSTALHESTLRITALFINVRNTRDKKKLYACICIHFERDTLKHKLEQTSFIFYFLGTRIRTNMKGAIVCHSIRPGTPSEQLRLDMADQHRNSLINLTRGWKLLIYPSYPRPSVSVYFLFSTPASPHQSLLTLKVAYSETLTLPDPNPNPEPGEPHPPGDCLETKLQISMAVLRHTVARGVKASETVGGDYVHGSSNIAEGLKKLLGGLWIRTCFLSQLRVCLRYTVSDHCSTTFLK